MSDDHKVPFLRPRCNDRGQCNLYLGHPGPHQCSNGLQGGKTFNFRWENNMVVAPKRKRK